MKEEERLFQEGEEELFEFEIDDLSEEDSKEASSDPVLGEEDTDLADVVDEGRIIEALESDDIMMSLEEDEFPEESDIDLGLLESQFEDSADDELVEDTAPDIKGWPESRLLEEMPASEKAAVFQLTEELIGGVSEERIEAIITRAVQDIVEKVTRETMTTIAEKVIGDALGALKQSLESPKEYKEIGQMK